MLLACTVRGHARLIVARHQCRTTHLTQQHTLGLRTARNADGWQWRGRVGRVACLLFEVGAACVHSGLFVVALCFELCFHGLYALYYGVLAGRRQTVDLGLDGLYGRAEGGQLGGESEVVAVGGEQMRENAGGRRCRRTRRRADRAGRGCGGGGSGSEGGGTVGLLSSHLPFDVVDQALTVAIEALLVPPPHTILLSSKLVPCTLIVHSQALAHVALGMLEEAVRTEGDEEVWTDAIGRVVDGGTLSCAGGGGQVAIFAHQLIEQGAGGVDVGTWHGGRVAAEGLQRNDAA